jgi:hypothetical protein
MNGNGACRRFQPPAALIGLQRSSHNPAPCLIHPSPAGPLPGGRARQPWRPAAVDTTIDEGRRALPRGHLGTSRLVPVLPGPLAERLLEFSHKLINAADRGRRGEITRSGIEFTQAKHMPQAQARHDQTG